MLNHPNAQILNKVGNHHQIGGIETSIIDNGKAKGVRIAWINTGAGLRYKVVLDRAMDIADAHFNQHNLSWISHVGIASSAKTGIYKDNWLEKFGGGLLTTCGLSHVGASEEDEYGQRGLHGDIGYEPAEIITIKQPNLLEEKSIMSITGITKETSSFGKHLELRRTIYSILGEAAIYIEDEVTNVSYSKIPHMFMYHCNFGWPLIDEGTLIDWEGNWEPRGTSSDSYIFNNNNNFKNCLPPVEESNEFNGEACVFVDIKPNEKGICKTSIINHKLNLMVEISFNKKELPWFTNWLHFKKGEYVVGLEPGTNPPIGQAKARKDNSLIFLKPHETRKYNIKITVKNSDKI